MAGAGGDEEDEEEEEEEEAELEELLGPSPLALGPGAQRVAVVHPAVKWGPKKPPLTTGAWPRRGGGGSGRLPPAGPGGQRRSPAALGRLGSAPSPPAPLQRSSARGKTRREPVPVAWSRAVIAVVELRNVAGADERKANSDQRSGAPFPSAGTF